MRYDHFVVLVDFYEKLAGKKSKICDGSARDASRMSAKWNLGIKVCLYITEYMSRRGQHIAESIFRLFSRLRIGAGVCCLFKIFWRH